MIVVLVSGKLAIMLQLQTKLGVFGYCVVLIILLRCSHTNAEQYDLEITGTTLQDFSNHLFRMNWTQTFKDWTIEFNITKTTSIQTRTWSPYYQIFLRRDDKSQHDIVRGSMASISINTYYDMKYSFVIPEYSVRLPENECDRIEGWCIEISVPADLKDEYTINDINPENNRQCVEIRRVCIKTTVDIETRLHILSFDSIEPDEQFQVNFDFEVVNKSPYMLRLSTQSSDDWNSQLALEFVHKQLDEWKAIPYNIKEPMSDFYVDPKMSKRLKGSAYLKLTGESTCQYGVNNEICITILAVYNSAVILNHQYGSLCRGIKVECSETESGSSTETIIILSIAVLVLIIFGVLMSHIVIKHNFADRTDPFTHYLWDRRLSLPRGRLPSRISVLPDYDYGYHGYIDTNPARASFIRRSTRRGSRPPGSLTLNRSSDQDDNNTAQQETSFQRSADADQASMESDQMNAEVNNSDTHLEPDPEYADVNNSNTPETQDPMYAGINNSDISRNEEDQQIHANNQLEQTSINSASSRGAISPDSAVESAMNTDENVEISHTYFDRNKNNESAMGSAMNPDENAASARNTDENVEISHTYFKPNKNNESAMGSAMNPDKNVASAMNPDENVASAMNPDENVASARNTDENVVISHTYFEPNEYNESAMGSARNTDENIEISHTYFEPNILPEEDQGMYLEILP